MVVSPLAVDVALPQDLAGLFNTTTTVPVPVRSTTATLMVGGIAVASTAITFLQGPPAVAYWVQVTRDWLRRRRNEGVGELRFKGPGGEGVFQITADTDVEELASALHRVLFPRRDEIPPVDEDDIAL